MIPALLDFLRTLTTPDRLIHLLSTVLSGWLGYAALTAIVFTETGLLVGFVLPFTYGLNWLLDRLMGQRVAVEGEHQGMDLYELGAGAYPEFMTHTDDFMR